MDIGIIGSGHIGSTLARHLAALGHQVSIANSRGPASLVALAADTGAIAATVEQATRARDMIIIAYLRNRCGKCRAISWPTPRRSWSTRATITLQETAASPRSSAACRKGARLLGRPVIKAFNNILADSLATRGVPAGTPGRICLSVAGDDLPAKAKVLSLIDALGFDALDAGTLADSWRQQPGTPAYCRDLDIKGLKAALAEADAAQILAYRAQADEATRAYFAGDMKGQT
jgi:predicted dinucleotide-binding enzyme